MYTIIGLQTEVSNMVVFTIAVPKELKDKLDKHPDINWSEVLKEFFERKVTEFEKFEELKSKGVI